MNHQNEPVTGLKTKPASTTDTLAKAAHQVISNAATKAEPVEKQLRERAENAGAKISQKQEAASEQIERTVRQAEKFAKERPLAAAGIAFAAGILATTLLRR